MKKICAIVLSLLIGVLVLSGCGAEGGDSEGGSLAAPKITATAEDYGAIYIKWDSVKGASKYNTYRRTYDEASDDWGEWENINSTKNDSCTDSEVIPGVRYAYRVRAVAGDKDKSDYSNVEEVTAKEATIPFVSVESESKGSVTVSLRPVEGVSMYRIYRRERNEAAGSWGEWEFLVEIDADTTTYTDTNVTSGTKYGYRATAVSSNGTETNHSNGANVTVQ